MSKICNKCGEEKPATTEYFYKDRGNLHCICRTCFNAKRRERYRNNPAKERSRQKEYYEANKIMVGAICKNYRMANTERVKEYHKQYRQNPVNKKRKKLQATTYMAKRRATDINVRIADSLRARVAASITKGYKSAATLELLGCSIEQLKKHLEKNFDSSMNWGNYGSYWHIDHKRPCSSFDLTDPEQQKQCCHYSNLQPLEAKENIRKGAKWSS